MDYTKLGESLVKLFLGENNLEEIKYKLEIVPSVSERKYQLRPNDDILNYNNNSIGSMVLPDPPDGNYYILISNNLTRPWHSDKYEFFETLIHEVVHLHDYIDYANRYCDNNYLDIVKHCRWLYLYFHSEYRAKRNGLIYYYKIQDIKVIPEKTVEEKYNLAFYTLTRYLISSQPKSPEVIDFCYQLFRFLGKLSAFETSFPDKFPKERIYKDFNKYNLTSLKKFYESLDFLDSFRCGVDDAVKIIDSIIGEFEIRFKH